MNKKKTKKMFLKKWSLNFGSCERAVKMGDNCGFARVTPNFNIGTARKVGWLVALTLLHGRE